MSMVYHYFIRLVCIIANMSFFSTVLRWKFSLWKILFKKKVIYVSTRMNYLKVWKEDSVCIKIVHQNIQYDLYGEHWISVPPVKEDQYFWTSLVKEETRREYVSVSFLKKVPFLMWSRYFCYWKTHLVKLANIIWNLLINNYIIITISSGNGARFSSLLNESTK